MKILSVFSLVILFHVVVISLLLIQPGCQSQPSREPDVSDTAPPPAAPSFARPTQSGPLDSSFNSGMPSAAASTRPGLSSPTRPGGVTRPSADTSMLTPVLDPVQDELTLPTIQGEYVVKSGDNLSSIARREGVSLNDLLQANNLNRSSTIFVGQKLVIPAGSPSAAGASSAVPVAAGRQVVVAGGDTLGKIASRAGTTVKALKSLNGLTSDTIYVGQKLMLPSGSSVQSVSQPQPAPATVPVTGGQTYTVKQGDTPSGIARRFGVTTSQLMAANGITDPRKMGIGQTLVIPLGGTTPTPQPASPASQPVRQRSGTAATPEEPVMSEPTTDDPMSILEALEDEDIPFAEVEVIEGENPPQN